MEVKRNLNHFEGLRLKFGHKIKLIVWLLCQNLIFKFHFLSLIFGPMILRAFGASIGNGVIMRRGVRVHFPWNLNIGNNCWIGEDVWFINHERISIGSNVCISQRSIICSGGHDYRSASLEYSHKPIEIRDGAWVCLDAKVLPGVKIGECSVVAAGEIARKTVPDYSMLINGKICQIEPPK
jgi:putative colanic acid biosynthesis acetyltransferase WcaF